MRTFLEKVRNKLSDLGDDISFLKRKDVSWRFKILNLISGDRLRFEMAINCMNADQAIKGLKDFYELIEKYPDTSKEVVNYFKAANDWNLKQLKKDLWGIWDI